MASTKRLIPIITALYVVAANAQRDFYSCPLGQFRDPVTGQCAGPSQWPETSRNCPLGQFVDPTTGQCSGRMVGLPPGPRRETPYYQQNCPPGQYLDNFTGQCVSLRNWWCGLCKECCDNPLIQQKVSQCYFDYQENFQGCLENYGISPRTANRLLISRSHPAFTSALRSLKF